MKPILIVMGPWMAESPRCAQRVVVRQTKDNLIVETETFLNGSVDFINIEYFNDIEKAVKVWWNRNHYNNSPYRDGKVKLIVPASLELVTEANKLALIEADKRAAYFERKVTPPAPAVEVELDIPE